MRSITTFWGGRLCDFWDHITWHNLPMTQAYNRNSDQNICWTWPYKKLCNLPPKILMSWIGDQNVLWNGIGLAIMLGASSSLPRLAWCLVEHSGQGFDPWTMYILTRVKLVIFVINCKKNWKRNILSQILFLIFFFPEEGIKQIATIAFNMKGCLGVSYFHILNIMAIYSYGWSPLEHQHKRIGEKNTELNGSNIK
jgi:hypothetical protein